MADLNLSDLGQYLARPEQQGLSALGSDRMSPMDEFLLYQKLLQQRDSANKTTIINPGQNWGGLDKLAIQPDDVMQSRVYARPPENI